MRSYIVETARDVLEKSPDADLDEVAAIAGVKASVVHEYFRTMGDLQACVAGVDGGQAFPRPRPRHEYLSIEQLAEKAVG